MSKNDSGFTVDRRKFMTGVAVAGAATARSEEHTSELQSH